MNYSTGKNAPIDITGWGQKHWYNTGGTRDKVYVESPDGKFYYFKTSLRKQATENRPERHYKFEFWNEIIVYQIGEILGLNVLPYYVAYTADNIGCISQSMIKGEESLVEGIKYIQGFMPEFNPANRKEHYQYSFQLINESLQKFGLDRFINDIIEIIVFDALIGNGDRHQENWATINKTAYSAELPDIGTRKTFKVRFSSLFNAGISSGAYTIKQEPRLDSVERFAPIYDNGSCLCRELNDSRVITYLENNDQLLTYIDRGKSEIHWKGEKKSHFELIIELLNSEFENVTRKALAKVLKMYDARTIEEIVNNVDIAVPEKFSDYIIPRERKQLIINVIHLRYKKLVALTQ